VARALIVGCGCRGRALGAELANAGWEVRGTTRRPEGVADIERAGIEAAVADPNRLGSVLDQIENVAVVLWLLGSAQGGAGVLEALHGERLERVIEELVDSPVRGFVYQSAGTVESLHLDRGAALVRRLGERHRIPVRVVDADPEGTDAWVAAMREAAESALLVR
jgi:nucleoside-diphosphate-sugar epimerase